MAKRIIIAGMTPETYDSDKDPRGEIGHALADAIYRESGRAAFGNVFDEREYWANMAAVTLPRFSELQRGERIHSSELSKRLGQIREAGYKVPPYSHLPAKEKWILLGRIRADVRKNAQQYCPEVLRQINFENRRQRMDARGDLR